MILAIRRSPTGGQAKGKAHRIGASQGTALLTGGVLGPGVLALPGLAAQAAGPAAVVAWAGLLALSVPVALTFAVLGARFPGGGGVAAFASRAFGPRVSALAGWWFYLSIPCGVFAGALIGGEYVAAELGLGRAGAFATAVALLAVAFAANFAGLRLSGRLQLLLTGLLVLLLVTAVLAAAPHVRAADFVPFAPHGWTGVVHAAGVLFFAFVGWEAASHLSGDFADPRRDLYRATVLTLVIAGVLYVGLAVASAGVLRGPAGESPVALTALLELGIGGAARPVTAVAALVLSFGALNTYIAGIARLGPALAREGALPRPVATAAMAGRGLAAPAALTTLAAASAAVLSLDLDALMRSTSACLAAVTAIGCAAAARLLTGRPRRLAQVATAFTLLVLASCGAYLLIPTAIALAVLLGTGTTRTSPATPWRPQPGAPR
ncbi:amino acid permease [Sphaerisporangium sp. TRM90804]|uniref:amino acid permease n=1 Tax=Sphaerisporangium sp. TRM90804 TaxID=3031113 RepID=UPI00244BB2A6|nr:amino acid permease [Sphaerisporangium sp. TRM90804]MDH2428211.1 amino acid permease [Sphaerisporangium sp. TRM90804]